VLILREATTVRLSERLLAAYLNRPNGSSVRTPWLAIAAQRVILHTAIGLGIFAAIVLVLIQAARSHLPVVPFAIVLLVALTASVYSSARRSRRRQVPRQTPSAHAHRRSRAA
jgi:MFS superfamily sulfate permease-like transporter